MIKAGLAIGVPRFLGAVAATVLAASAAWAGVDTLAQSGPWRAFGGTTNNGTGVCGISKGDEQSYFGLKQFAGDTEFTIQMSQKSWNAKKGDTFSLTLRFDGGQAWNVKASGMTFSDGDPGMEFEIPTERMLNFFAEFQHASQLVVGFANGSTWSIPLAGTKDVGAAFLNCNRNLK